MKKAMKKKTLKSEKLYNDIVVKAFGRNRPTIEEWLKYLDGTKEFLRVYIKYLGPVPDAKDIASIKSKTNSLLKLLKKPYTYRHYDDLIRALFMSEVTTINLKARRSKSKNKKTILTEKNKAVYRDLNILWKEYRKKNITGTYRNDNSIVHEKRNIAEFDPAKNPGAFLVQATLREYFGVTLDCKQTKDLIQNRDKQ